MALVESKPRLLDGSYDQLSAKIALRNRALVEILKLRTVPVSSKFALAPDDMSYMHTNDTHLLLMTCHTCILIIPICYCIGFSYVGLYL